MTSSHWWWGRLATYLDTTIVRSDHQHRDVVGVDPFQGRDATRGELGGLVMTNGGLGARAPVPYSGTTGLNKANGRYHGGCTRNGPSQRRRSAGRMGGIVTHWEAKTSEYWKLETRVSPTGSGRSLLALLYEYCYSCAKKKKHQKKWNWPAPPLGKKPAWPANV